MGICFSVKKKRKDSPSRSSPPPPPSSVVAEHSTSPPRPPPAATATPAAGNNMEQPIHPSPPNHPSPPSHAEKPQNCKPEETLSKKPLFLITPSKTKKPTSPEAPVSSSTSVEEVVVRPTLLDDATLVAPPRASSCTKEEVESILIQCGRLSRSSSGNADGNGRRYSGSKRSYDFDNEKRAHEGEDWERSLHHSSSSRPSPRRRAHSRERDSGGRRVSRSPGKRTEQPVASGGPRQPPGKMVSVPAREKSSGNNGSSGGAGERGSRRNQWNGGRGSNGPFRSSSPRSRSPVVVRVVANENNSHVHGGGNGVGHQPLSRSSSRKADQSPYRRNPMAEIDENRGRGEQKAVGDKGFATKNKAVTQTLPQQEITNEEQEQPQPPPPPPMDGKPLGISRSRSSRRSSRDLDAVLSNPAASSYASVLLEDINNYHHQKSSGPQLSLPVCVSKACSIVEAVADLNNDSFSSSGQPGSKVSSFAEPKLEQCSLHKFVSVRNKVVVVAETEPQESAGSNSFVGQQHWGAGSCDGNAAESSSHRCGTTSWSEQREEVEEGGSRSCNGLEKGGANSGRRKELENQRRVRRGISSGGGRAYSAPVGVVASSTSSAAAS